MRQLHKYVRHRCCSFKLSASGKATTSRISRLQTALLTFYGDTNGGFVSGIRVTQGTIRRMWHSFNTAAKVSGAERPDFNSTGQSMHYYSIVIIIIYFEKTSTVISQKKVSLNTIKEPRAVPNLDLTAVRLDLLHPTGRVSAPLWLLQAIFPEVCEEEEEEEEDRGMQQFQKQHKQCIRLNCCYQWRVK
ncbi:hypothetical protein ABVT39_021190 [Epinephelus coioides]